VISGDYQYKSRKVKKREGDNCYGVYDVPSDKKMLPATDEARQWQGYGTALKPAWEPIVVARKPVEVTVASNVLKWGVGGLNIDGCRIGTIEVFKKTAIHSDRGIWGSASGGVPRHNGHGTDNPSGRFPANFIHDGSDEVMDLFPITTSGENHSPRNACGLFNGLGGGKSIANTNKNSGSAARFFYCAKASKRDRDEGLEDRNTHPTVKPIALMRYLCRLVTPPNGVILDPFMGSGSTGKAAVKEGFRFIGIDKEVDYCEIAGKRIGAATEENRRFGNRRVRGGREFTTD
jgi:site-specific DNA-methyltransferase (adenine-specific)